MANHWFKAASEWHPEPANDDASEWSEPVQGAVAPGKHEDSPSYRPDAPSLHSLQCQVNDLDLNIALGEAGLNELAEWLKRVEDCINAKVTAANEVLEQIEERFEKIERKQLAQGTSLRAMYSSNLRFHQKLRRALEEV